MIQRLLPFLTLTFFSLAWRSRRRTSSPAPISRAWSGKQP